jgi:hypothetical protein
MHGRQAIEAGWAKLAKPGVLTLHLLDLQKLKCDTATQNKVVLLLDKHTKRIAVRKYSESADTNVTPVTLRFSSNKQTAQVHVAGMFRIADLSLDKCVGVRTVEFKEDGQRSLLIFSMTR